MHQSGIPFGLAGFIIFLSRSVLPIDGPFDFEESSLDNGVLRVGINTTAYGGAITHLSRSGSNYNLINNHDRGRQVQQSYYAGQDIDRRPDGQSDRWSPWPWNPIQVGDVFFNSSPVLSHTNDGNEIYTKTSPLLWDMNNEAAQCHVESWIRLDDNTVRVRNRLTIFRTDDLWEDHPRHQELPAVYPIADLFQIYTYKGNKPFSNEPLTKIRNTGPPWAYWGADGDNESWAACVNADQWGIGVYSRGTEEFVGGLHGSPGGGTLSASTAYMSPLRTLTLGKNAVFEYEFVLIVGSLEEIRKRVYEIENHLPNKPPPRRQTRPRKR